MQVIKYSLFHLLTIIAIAAFLLGHQWIPLTFLATSAFIVFGDLWLGDDTSTPEVKHKLFYDIQLYLALPLMLCLMLAAIWQFSDTDLFGIGQALSAITGYDFLESRMRTNHWHMLAGIFYCGLLISTVGTVTAHELVHRTWSNGSVTLGRWLLAFSFDANFSIEHVYGHHRHIGTRQDPATAPRGRNVYTHILLSTWGGNISAWNIERTRLARAGLPLFSFHNQCIRGYTMSVVLLSVIAVFSGPYGLLFFTMSGVWAKCMLEIVNYVEHYGIVRVPNMRVLPRHSWNTNRKISSWSLFNLSRHSHHHAHAATPYQSLKPFEDAPQMLSGYLASVLLSLFPPLWFKLITPRLAYWDEHFATEDEKKLAQLQ